MRDGCPAPNRPPLRRLLPLLALALGLGGPAAAQYKVIAPDGSVTYTDRAPADASAKVQPMRRDGSVAAAPAAAAASPVAALPFELRAVVARFPVTLYTSDKDCAPCERGRSLLLQRGVPFTERSVTSDDDIAALQRLSGGRSVPTLTIGGQALRGFQEQDWQTTLDLAGYPKESRLPRTWQPAPATPLVARGSVERAGVAEPLVIAGDSPTAGAPSAGIAPPPAPAASAGIRF